MKQLLAIVIALAGIFIIAMGVAATPLAGEVVMLHTQDNGEWSATPLWIVDDGDREYLRAGVPDNSGWVTRMRANPDVRLER